LAQPPLQRRLAAILAADVVGYSRLMGRDEAGTHSRVKALLRELVDPIVKAHKGRVVKTTGDGVLAEFASATEAVSAAVNIQRSVLDHNAVLSKDKHLILRIGLNLGDLIVDTGDIYGDGVNVAVRLEGICEPGGVCISRAVWEQVAGRVPYRFEDGGEHQVKNIDRPIAVYRLSPDAIAPLAPPRTILALAQQAGGRRLAASLALVVAASLMAVAGAHLWWNPWGSTGGGVAGAGQTSESTPTPPEATAATQPSASVLLSAPEPMSDQPISGNSLVVLPFVSLSSGPDVDQFADAITDDLITDLDRVADLLVIARNTAFTHKGRAVDVRQVGRDLRVRYVLEGSVRRAGDQVRVNAQMVDAESGGQLWAERFEGAAHDLASLPDRITTRVAKSLNLQIMPTVSRDKRQVDHATPRVSPAVPAKPEPKYRPANRPPVARATSQNCFSFGGRQFCE
jgi:adenylate cyclase